MDGKVVIITGSNTGIGYVAAREIAKKGAHVFLACRDAEKTAKAMENIKKESGNSNIESIPLDLSSLQSVREFADKFKEKNLPLDILINNAGIMALPERSETKDGFEMQIGVNHLGHFLLTNLLLENLKKGTESRVVNVSSEGHKLANLDLEDLQLKSGYGAWRAYGNSKLANILFTKELQKRCEGTNVSAFAVHPGIVKTELGRNMNSFYGFFFRLFGKSPDRGALTTLHCALDNKALDHKGGYFADSSPKQPSSMALNAEIATKLWNISEELVGLSSKSSN
eukprot:TRINITY_DN6280_c0_g1_i2.p1 TRINITY_DN6280_c0_g1~~TRINITY_DN6280_c0_g1_i2.p1  ORF type:complete len:290 (+),score=69.22 TRINITY_DN6280_c0_g1_i2:22-870(+)